MQNHNPRVDCLIPRLRNARRNQRRGAMLVVIAIMAVGFLITSALSIDIANKHLSRTELRIATDAAAKAAAVTLADSYIEESAIRRGKEIAAANFVHGEPLLLDSIDFVFGRSRENASGKFEFTADRLPKNSVRVVGRRTVDSPSGAISRFFPNMMGMRLFEPTCQAAATYIDRDVVLVVDRNGSEKGRSFDDVVTAIDTFVDALRGTPINEQVGLASYSDKATDNDATDNLPLTSDPDAIKAGIRRLWMAAPNSVSRGMQAGQSILESRRGIEYVEQTMIVLTDSMHNRGPEPRDVANALAAEGVTIHTITFGSYADRERMKEVAAIGRGRHYHATDGLQLQRIYREIALTLNTMMTQ